MKTADLIAIDVHTHAEISCRQPDDDYAQVQSLVATFDAPAKAKEMAFRIVPLQNTRVADLRETLESIASELRYERQGAMWSGVAAQQDSAPTPATQGQAPQGQATPPARAQGGGAPPSDDAFKYGSPPALPAGTSQEQMLPAATGEGRAGGPRPRRPSG
jgi:hypothetical protein